MRINLPDRDSIRSKSRHYDEDIERLHKEIDRLNRLMETLQYPDPFSPTNEVIDDMIQVLTKHGRLPIVRS